MNAHDLAITCSGSPVQIEGEASDGARVYFRFRWGTATLSVNGEQMWTRRYGHDMSGVMDEEAAMNLVRALLDLRAADLALRRELPLGPVPPLDAEAEAMWARLMGPSPTQS